MKNRTNIALVTMVMVIALILMGCGGGTPAETTTSSAPVTTSSAPVTTSSVPVTTSSVPVTTNSTPATTSSAPTTTSSTPTGGSTIIKVAWGIPPMLKTHPLDGAFANCYTCHLIGAVGAVYQIGASHSCDECHEPKGPGLTYYCTGGDPPTLPSCKMCHGPQREYDGTKHTETTTTTKSDM